MGFFDSETKEAPRPEILETPWGPQARGVLQNLMTQNVRFPTQQIAGMTGTERNAQGVLANLLAGGTFQDPATSTLYRGLRDESRMDEDRAISGLRRRQQLGGMYSSVRAPIISRSSQEGPTSSHASRMAVSCSDPSPSSQPPPGSET